MGHSEMLTLMRKDRPERAVVWTHPPSCGNALGLQRAGSQLPILKNQAASGLPVGVSGPFAS